MMFNVLKEFGKCAYQAVAAEIIAYRNRQGVGDSGMLSDVEIIFPGDIAR